MNLMKSRWRHDCPTLFDALITLGSAAHLGLMSHENPVTTYAESSLLILMGGVTIGRIEK
jgi:hypothetical protein